MRKHEDEMHDQVSEPVVMGSQLNRREVLRRTGLAGAGLAVSPLLDATVAAAVTQEAATSGGTASVFWTRPSFLNPLFSSAGVEQGVARQIFGALVKLTADLEVVPDLAETIDVSADAKTYTFHLKQDLMFSDGQPLTAQDVVFTIERAVDERTGSFWRSRLLEIEGAAEYGDQRSETISGLEAPDEHTVTMTLTQPNSVWLVTLADFAGLGILPAHALQDIPPEQLAETDFFQPLPSAGAFTFDEWQADQYLAIKRNDNYGGGPAANLDRILLRVLSDANVGAAQLETGELDLMTLSRPEVERLEELPDLTVSKTPSPSLAYITCNLDRPFLQDKRVRQAMAHALDREGIVAALLGGEAEIVNSPIYGPEWMGTPEGLNEYPYDPAVAQELLSAANWDSDQVVIMHYIPGVNPVVDALMPVVQQQLGEVGMNIELVTVDTPESNRRVVTSATTEQAGEYDIWLNAGGGVFRVDPNMTSKHFTRDSFTPSGANFSHYHNPDVDELLLQGRATADEAERRAIYTEVARILNDEVPWICLWSPFSYHGFNDRLQGFDPPSYASNLIWNAEDWSVTE